jgi:outer membrane usher protein
MQRIYVLILGSALLVLSAGVAAADALAATTPASAPVDASPESAAGTAAPLGELVVGVQSGGRLIADFESVISQGGGRFLVTAELFAALRLKLPAVAPENLRGIPYYPLNAIPGVTCSFDSAQQVLVVSVASDAVTPTTIQMRTGSQEEPDIPGGGVFLNHDFEVTGSGTHYGISGVEEVGAFSKLGVFTTRILANHTGDTTKFSRLGSQFVHDFPDRMETLSIGDNVSAASAWGRSVYYAGVRWASNFATQSSFVPYALPTLAGQAAQPSTVDLYVNNVRTSSQNIDAGPFTLREIPTITPQGDVRMVITDVTGRQQVIEAPYISAPQLLRKGIHDYAYDAGTLRSGIGLTSAGYHSAFLSATDRRGLTDSLTLDLHGEFQGNLQAGGIGLTAGVLPVGVISAGAAVSRNRSGRSGTLVYATVQHTTRGFGLALSSRVASQEFTQLGLMDGERVTRFTGQAQVTRAIGRHVTLSAAYTLEEKPGLPVYDQNGAAVARFSAVSPSLSINLGRRCSLVASGYYAPELKRPASVFLSLVIPLGSRRTQSDTATYENRKASTTVDYAQQLPVGTGWGYRARTTTTNNLSSRGADVGVTYQSSVGAYSVELGQQSGSPTDWRAGYAGSSVWMGNRLMLGRTVTDGFAVVDADGAAGIPVFANNQYVAKTNRSGLAFVPNLPAYSPSEIALDESATPMDLDADFQARKVVPMRRTGVFVNLKAKPISGALLKLVTADGSEIPMGAKATVKGAAETYEVVLHGELYVPEISFPASVHVQWGTKSCDATVPAPTNPTEVLPQIGPVVCRDGR